MAPATAGGSGGANTTAPVAAVDAGSNDNGGGGGAAVGRIFTRGVVSSGASVVSPPAGSGALVAQ